MKETKDGHTCDAEGCTDWQFNEFPRCAVCGNEFCHKHTSTLCISRLPLCDGSIVGKFPRCCLSCSGELKNIDPKEFADAVLQLLSKVKK